MTQLEWQFGGWLHGWPVTTAAGLLAVLAASGLIYVGWFYRRTLSQLSPAARITLTALRAVVVLLLLLCLANPVRVQTDNRTPDQRHTLAVVVDRSASMSAPDHRGSTRLADAVRLWKQHEPAAARSYSKITYHRFASELHPAANLNEATSVGAAVEETHLFATLHQVLETKPAAIVCLTDGLDTTTDNAGKLAGEAVRLGVPIYFVPGENRVMPGTSLTLREINAPSSVLRQSQFNTSALIEVAAAKERELPVELWSGDTKLAAAQLPVRVGHSTFPWAVTVTSGEPGPMPLEFRVGENPPQIAACTTEVVENTTLEVLYYQGALQWGYRFLRGALETDPSFRLTAILNPALGVQMISGVPGQSSLTDLPDDARELKRFSIVVLAHVFADRLTPKQQRALVEYARGGGGVLFISPDTSATARFSGTVMEEMLPVVFGARNATTSENFAAQRLQQQLAQISSQSDGFSPVGHEQITLKPFTLPEGGRRSAASALFANTNAGGLPKFSENAAVRAIKPGAELLAVSGNTREVLLARQQFGSGFTAALTTDLLWRWKLSLPSSSRAVEKFWQQLLLSLAPASGQGLRVVKITAQPAANLPVALRINSSAADGTPTVEAVSPVGKRTRLSLRETSGGGDTGWDTSFTPTVIGSWEVRATNSLGHTARVTFPVAEKPHSVELLNLPADIAGMRQLADSTGGAVVDKTTVFQSPAELAGVLPKKYVQPLWNSGWLLAVLLGFYATELTIRRRFKLL